MGWVCARSLTSSSLKPETGCGFTETRLGILPSVISPFVIAKIGETHARALFPSGRRFDATRALQIGLVHEVVEGEPALDGCRRDCREGICSRQGRPRRAPPRRSSARFAVFPTSRRAGTPHGALPVSGRVQRGRKGCARSWRSATPPGESRLSHELTRNATNATFDDVNDANRAW